MTFAIMRNKPVRKLNVCHTIIPKDFGEREAVSLVATLPESEQLIYFRRMNPLARLQFLFGRLLIGRMYTEFNPFEPCKIVYGPYGKPRIAGVFQPGISITHSGQMVVCAIHSDGPVGVDVEFIRPIQWQDFREYFKPDEWHHIQNHSDPSRAFFDLWTCKEAVSKADGRGLGLDFQNMDVLSGRIVVEAHDWHFTHLLLGDKFAAVLAFLQRQQEPVLSIRQVDFHELLEQQDIRK